MGCASSSPSAQSEPAPKVNTAKGKDTVVEVKQISLMQAAMTGTDVEELEAKESAKLQGMSMTQTVDYFRTHHTEHVACRAAAKACLDMVRTDEGLKELAEYEMASFLLPVVGTVDDIVAKARCLQLILVLTDVVEQRDEMLGCGGVKQVLSAMSSCDDIEVLKSACVLLRKFTQSNDKDKARLVAHQSIPQILETLSAHKQSAALVVEALITLQGMVPMANNQAMLLHKKAVKRIVHAMEAHLQNTDVLTHSCHTLSHALYNSHGNQAEFTRYGAHKVVLNSLKEYPEDVNVQWRGLMAMRRACTTNRENQDSIAALGFLEVVLAAMASFADDINVQEAACWAIRDFAADNEKNAELCSSANVRKTLDGNLAQHPQAMELTRAAHAALKEFVPSE